MQSGIEQKSHTDFCSIFIYMKRLLKLIREPVVLFFILGILIFVLYERTTGYIERYNKQIYVSQAQIALLEESYTGTWNRPPAEEELEALINDYIMDEIYYKEAVAMGLDKTDLTVKRRLRQMIELMMDDNAAIYPSEDQLRSYLSANPDKFRQDDRISFRQLHFAPDGGEEARNFLSKLQASESAIQSYTGGLLLLPENHVKEMKREIDRSFGTYFTTEIFKMETGRWQGPLESSYGWHLIYISEILQGELPELDEIWDLVEREWSVEKKKEIKEEQYSIMREQYKIIVEEL